MKKLINDMIDKNFIKYNRFNYIGSKGKLNINNPEIQKIIIIWKRYSSFIFKVY